jgi:hypothetical protein
MNIKMQKRKKRKGEITQYLKIVEGILTVTSICSVVMQTEIEKALMREIIHQILVAIIILTKEIQDNNLYTGIIIIRIS